ncbi:MAG: gp37gp68 family protein [Candidatus Magnetoglobus multicellularis str. Araruama]|uniref:Gp37gp68 family protein n=1 Tax=Candidatus Magnetoglobus multicellularis str. Araruama TaxID=890399 RepID=A0A1V1P5R7_9BACT|nr:MAG: gp37gp68 family protein [Candidatus Magnetoglobus multicellularis str. Araruama]
MNKTKIEWTDSTWNPTTGCTKISAGCKYCYAERMAMRLQAMGCEKYKNGFQLTIHPDTLKVPYSWKKPRNVFVNSMSDLFHENMPFEFIQKVFKVMNENPKHTFQILTKRSDILYEYSQHLTWSKNIWMGVTVESKQFLNRMKDLKKTNAYVKFLSMEPLISKINELNLSEIDWVIVGGESGPGSRPMIKEWVIDLKNMCQQQDVPFFFKQWGGINKKRLVDY